MKRLRGKAALDTWPQRLAAVKNEPTEDNLQALCSVLDEADSWVVRGWKGARHDQRLAIFLRMRAEARDAWAHVEARRQREAEVQGRAAAAAQAARKRRSAAVASPAGLEALVGGDAA